MIGYRLVHYTFSALRSFRRGHACSFDWRSSSQTGNVHKQRIHDYDGLSHERCMSRMRVSSLDLQCGIMHTLNLTRVHLLHLFPLLSPLRIRRAEKEEVFMLLPLTHRVSSCNIPRQDRLGFLGHTRYWIAGGMADFSIGSCSKYSRVP